MHGFTLQNLPASPPSFLSCGMGHTVFPVINSTLSPQHLAAWLADVYGLHKVQCSLLRTNMNDSYLVTAKEGKYVLRIYNGKYRNAMQVAEEVRILNELKEVISVAYPIAAASGSYVQEVPAPEGARQAVLFAYAEGKLLRNLSVQNSYDIGVLMGRMHERTQQMHTERITYDTDTLVRWAHEEASKYIAPQLEEMQWIERCISVLQEVFSRQPLRSGVVHLDVFYSNMAVHDDGTITLYDFDNVGNGWLVLDIGYYCMQLYFAEADKSTYEEKKNAFIAGYRSVLPVADEELSLISYAGLAIWIHYLGLQAQRFDYFANIFLSENYVKLLYINRAQDWLRYCGVAIP